MAVSRTTNLRARGMWRAQLRSAWSYDGWRGKTGDEGERDEDA